MEGSSEHYDVAILGGGLAGLCLALQLRKERPDTSVFVAEKREGPAPEAAFKVGESTVEIAADYFCRIVGVEDHIKQDELPKAGLRFFFPAGDNTDITQRPEWGDTEFAPVPTYQLDRGRFENHLSERCHAEGVDLRGGCRVQDVEIDAENGHTVAFTTDDGEGSVRARWVVDCAGRAFIVKRKLGLEEDVSHHINSAWFRVGNGLVDLEEWGSHDEQWMARMKEPGIRKYSTNHLTGQGYWVWLIPLASDGHSIGIVADPRFHPFEQINTFEAALDWLREHEPQLAKAMEDRKEDVQDFLKIEKFSHGCKRVFSPDRWALTGESGAFIDPLYSPGSDYIATGNRYAADLIKRDLDGEDVTDRAEGFNFAYLNLFRTALEAVWEDHYAEFGDAEVFTAKVTYDYVAYWGLVALRSYYDKLADIEFMGQVIPHFGRAFALSAKVQDLLRDWHALGQPDEPTGLHAVPSRFPGVWDRLKELKAGLDDDTVRDRFRTNTDLLEAMAVVLFHKGAKRLPDGQAPEPERRINPHAVSLKPDRWDEDGLFDDENGLTLEEAWERVPGFENMLYDELAARVS